MAPRLGTRLRTLMPDISSPAKVLFPDAGITKRQVVEYYEAVATRMLPHVSGRPLTLQRFPRGIDNKGFMQKNAPAGFPDTIGRVTVPKADGGTTVYAVLEEAADIPYLANQNTITFHVWTSRLPELDLVDRIIFDLDPPEGNVDQAREATELVGDALRSRDIVPSLMTTGSKGYHVVTPVVGLAADLASRFSWSLARLLAADHPKLVTDEFRIEQRKGRVFVDWMRNHPGATGVAPWSLRPRPNAPVAVPIEWDELANTEPGQWTLRDAGEREHDPIAAAAEAPQSIERVATEVVEEATARGFDTTKFDRFRS